MGRSLKHLLSQALPPRQMWRGALGVGFGLLVTEAISRWLLGTSEPWFVIPMGASAVLVFAVPASPLAQPWPVIGGNAAAALSGVVCHAWLGDSGLGLSCAAALAVAAMFSLRCLHPPGGAMAVTAVLGGPAVHAMGFQFVLAPVALNAALLALLGMVFHRWSGHEYPHRIKPQPSLHETADTAPSRRGGIRAEDIDAALASYGEILDIDRGDLEEILTRAQVHARLRQWRGLRCADIMSTDLVTASPDTSVDEAWQNLARHRIKCLPVVDTDRRLAGIVTVPDFFIDRTNPDMQRNPRMISAARVAEIMTRNVRSARADCSLGELAHWFSDQGLHHLPVTDPDGLLVGMVTQSDLVGALLAHPGASALRPL